MDYIGSIRGDVSSNKLTGMFISRKSPKNIDGLGDMTKFGPQFNEMVAEVKYSPKDQKHSISGGVRFDLANESYIKAKVTHDETLAVALAHKANSFLWLTIGAEVNKHMAAKVGCKLDLIN
eukprot:GHVN01030291.1.p1 GENE.GHVN01030291.1~~GHVN01030291.1.p1  ORF type:complete len:121 (+),score=20.25 GHVN01030291.1:174-536(+)